MDYSIIRGFYNALQDEESRYIFMCRVSHLFSGNRTYIRKMAEGTNRLFHPCKTVRNISKLSEDDGCRNAGLVLYGIGSASRGCMDFCAKTGLRVLAFCDSRVSRAASREQNLSHLGLPLIPLDILIRDSEYTNCRIAVSTITYQEEICDLLISKGVSHERLYIFDGEYACTNYVYQKQYFGPEFMRPADNEVFVDAGCYDGDSIKQFIAWCGGKYKKIYGLEPHPDQHRLTVDNLRGSGAENVIITQKGAWSCSGELPFVLEYGIGPEGARVADNGDIMISTVPIDELAGDERVTFIKMDVEGAELEALKGSEKVILRDKPRLAVCLYHKPEDILEIPLYLQELMPSYRFYIRHHNRLHSAGDIALDTVLYAV